MHIADGGGAITVRAFRGEPRWVTLQVQDMGPGVDPQIRNRLFEVGSTTKSGGVSSCPRSADRGEDPQREDRSRP